METKKAKVKSREFYKENTYNNKTMYVFFVQFENDEIKYLYNSSKQEPKYFEPGQEQEYEYELKKGTSKTGQDYEMHIVKPVYPKPNFKGGHQQLTLEEYIERKKVDAIPISLSYAHDMISDDDNGEKVKALAKIYLEWQNLHMDKILVQNKNKQ